MVGGGGGCLKTVVFSRHHSLRRESGGNSSGDEGVEWTSFVENGGRVPWGLELNESCWAVSKRQKDKNIQSSRREKGLWESLRVGFQNRAKRGSEGGEAGVLFSSEKNDIAGTKAVYRVRAGDEGRRRLNREARARKRCNELHVVPASWPFPTPYFRRSALLLI